MSITIKTREEIDILREGGKRLACILAEVVTRLAPGVSTLELDLIAERLIRASRGTPAFKGYRIPGVRSSYPATLCVSVNDEIVHAIPRKEKILREGDVVGLDIGMWYPGLEVRGQRSEIRKRVFSFQPPTSNLQPSLVTDMAVTVGVGKISREAGRLIVATKEALDCGIAAVRPGAHVGDIGHAVEERLKKDRLGVIRDLAGHGVGYDLHEDPFIPNFGSPGVGPELKAGMVIAIEPMASLGAWHVKLQDDEWTYTIADGSLGAHFEHTVAVVHDGAEILTRSPEDCSF